MKKQEKVLANFQKAYDEIMSLFKKEPKEYDYKDIEDFDDAYSIVKDSQTDIGDNLIEEYNKMKVVFGDDTYYNALAKIRIVVFAANGCDESFPDWKNGSQEKRHPWFYVDKPGVGFSFHVSDFDHSIAAVGSRLEYKDAAICKHFSTHKNFQPLYEIIIKK